MSRAALKTKLDDQDLKEIRKDHDWWLAAALPNTVLIGWTDRESAVFQQGPGPFSKTITIPGVAAEYIHSLLNASSAKESAG